MSGLMTEINNAHLSFLLEQKVTIVDIRRPEEWTTTGIVAGSLLLTFYDDQGNCDLQTWLAALQPLAPPDKPLILICRTGYRTGLIGELLLEQSSYQQLYNVTDGILGWIAEGYAVQPWTNSPE